MSLNLNIEFYQESTKLKEKQIDVNLGNTLEEIINKIKTIFNIKDNLKLQYKIKFSILCEEYKINNINSILNNYGNFSTGSIENKSKNFFDSKCGSYSPAGSDILFYNDKIGNNIFNLVENSQFFYELDNQFEIIKNNNINYILYVTYIKNDNNSNTNLNISEINENNKLKNIKTINLFEDYIREIRNFYNKYNSKNYILASSRNNEIKVFEFLENAELALIKYIKNIYNQKENLSSSVIKFDSKLNNSEIITSCWLPDKIKKYKFENKEDDKKEYTDINNVKYMNIYLNEYLLFCGCNSEDLDNCCNCIDLSQNIKYKYKDKCNDQKENLFLNLIVYDNDNNKNQDTSLLVCDQIGYIRIFNFYKRDLIGKVRPCTGRINTILFINNKIFITEKRTGDFYILDIDSNYEINQNKTKKIKVFDHKIFSLRYLSETKSEILVVANGSDNSELENINDIERKYSIKLIILND